MTASEFSFLALGLVLGLVSGAALIEFLRARPPSTPQVKVTVWPDSVPRRRASTLADAVVGSSAEPARGGPADRRVSTNGLPPGMIDRRTSVPVEDPKSGGLPSDRPHVSRRNVSDRPDREGRPRVRRGPGRRRRSVAVDLQDVTRRAAAEASDGGSGWPRQDGDPAIRPPRRRSPPTGPCAEERRIADERCEVASRARGRADAAADALRAARLAL